MSDREKMAKTKARLALEFVRREAARAESGTDLHNAFFGNGGECGRLFPTREERDDFYRSDEYQEIARIQEALDQRPQLSATKSSMRIHSSGDEIQ
jgi:hypothetical protein